MFRDTLYLIVNDWQDFLWKRAEFNNPDLRLGSRQAQFERPGYRHRRYGNAVNVFMYSPRLANICIDLGVRFAVVDE